ncbi:TniQ family protein [Neorhizobium alkalisoli]|uniref:TniQ protein n=1 Tax=Neorhizobium alkalisoli TaxID=528178 RepID=A0A561QGH6_9HYPH|nr:TniQ family protein [Neorhizobium alkalisoli]TWF49470.1 TniQ protein [Neorhizobium alkalisoli]
MLLDVELHPFEDILSYLSRVAAVNGVPSTASMLRQMDTTPHEVWLGKEVATAAVCANLSRPFHQVRRASFVPLHEGVYSVAGSRILHKELWTGAPRFCPLCILDDMKFGRGPERARSFARLSWRLRSVGACHVHSVALMTSRSRGLRHEFYNAVSSDPTYVCFKAERLEPVSLHEADRYFASRLDGATLEHPWLDAIPYDVASGVAARIGILVRHGARTLVRSLPEVEMLAARREGFGVLSAGASGFEAFSRYWIRKKWKRNTTNIGRHLFGELYQYLEANSGDQGTSQVAEVLRKVASDGLPLERGRKFLGTRGNGGVQTIRGVVLHYGIPHKRVMTILQEEGVLVENAELHDITLKFDVSSVRSRLEAEAGGISYRTLLTRYNLQLFKGSAIFDGRFSWALRPKTIAQSSRRRTFFSHHADALLNHLTIDASAGKHPGRCVLTTAARKAECSLNDILVLLMERRLGHVSYDPDLKFLGIQVSVEEVRNKLPISSGNEPVPK